MQNTTFPHPSTYSGYLPDSTPSFFTFDCPKELSLPADQNQEPRTREG
ncbi:hypothetical protein BofuT4_P097470.1 [Botrytis cinerea T4]|uniref:Uncharacterized protein n=1 Tax=Botryotinia fuckeliana (strain T4) TaxID=999810 RepID=G2YCZ1_BOTF4|nr:hypothetical protein BofuT4_P097470.1 [Botrytis cinerea T4]